MTGQRCVIVGAGHAGAQMCLALRKKGWNGEILVIGDEPTLPYQRPPLSKAYLRAGASACGGRPNGDSAPPTLIRPASAYARADVTLRLNVRVAAIDRERKTLRLSDGENLPWHRLALTTGARVRTLDIPGTGLDGVCYLRNLADAAAICARVAPGRRALVIGGGYIGLETAASLRSLGMEVQVLEALPEILQRVTAPAVAQFFRRLHREEGVEIRTNTAVEAIHGERAVSAVACADGSLLPADLVIIGVGVIPETALAEAAGLQVDNGIRVDGRCRTSDPDIVAAGDCTAFYSRHFGRNLHLESVQNAVDQATAAAAELCGVAEAYDPIPWFWSDQFDVKWQMAGLSQGYDQLVFRGDPASGRQFAAFYLRDGLLLAVDAVNAPQAYMAGRRLIAAGRPLSVNALSDSDRDLLTLLR